MEIHLAESKSVEVFTKLDGSPVTVADTRAETAIRSMILEAFPQDGFVGEEGGTTAGSSGRVWYADPLDGTIQFISGMEDYGVLIAMKDPNGIQLGILGHSARETIWVAERGCGTYRMEPDLFEGYEIVAKPCVNRMYAPRLIERAIACFGHLHRMYGAGMDVGVLVSRFKTHLPVPRFLMFTLVAQGSLDVAVARLVNDWDLFANQIIVEEAGGTVISIQLKNGRWVVAARSRELAEQAITAIQESIY